LPKTAKISSATVRADFNDPIAVVHYARAAHFLGLWKSEMLLIDRFFPDRSASLLEAGCGAGRVTVGLWDMGFRKITAFDFAEELVDQARTLVADRGADGIQIFHADATQLSKSEIGRGVPASSVGSRAAKTSRPALARKREKRTKTSAQSRFDGVLFMFNGLMQIPGRANRRAALKELARLARRGAPILFTTHDRNSTPLEQALWLSEARRWSEGRQDPQLVEFGDRYFSDESGRTFMHLPDREEILGDLKACGWKHEFDSLRRDLTKESRAVQDFSDECRFWVGRKE